MFLLATYEMSDFDLGPENVISNSTGNLTLLVRLLLLEPATWIGISDQLSSCAILGGVVNFSVCFLSSKHKLKENPSQVVLRVFENTLIMTS